MAVPRPWLKVVVKLPSAATVPVVALPGRTMIGLILGGVGGLTMTLLGYLTVVVDGGQMVGLRG